MAQLHPLISRALEIAQRDLKNKVVEVPRGSNRGPRVDQYLTTTGYAVKPGRDGEPWCACFNYTIFDEAARSLGMKNPLPKTGYCPSKLADAKKRGILFDAPEVGDEFLSWSTVDGVWRASHTGLVVKVSADRRFFWTIEGNTNDGKSRDGYGVFAHKREVSSRYKFIRWAKLLKPVVTPQMHAAAKLAKKFLPSAHFSGKVKDGMKLRGDGTWPFTAIVDGDDIVLRGVRATWFGGDNDPMDDGRTASGVMTKGYPKLMGCALPLRNRSVATPGSPIPLLPWGTEVLVYCPMTNKAVKVELIDVGPGKRTGNAIDLTQSAFRALGVPLSKGVITVDFRIVGGAQFVSKGN